MRFLFGSLGSLLAGSFAWWLGELWSPLAAVVLGAIGGGMGLFYGRRLFDDWLG